MPITFRCPLCKAAVKVSTKHAGMRSRCSSCSGEITVPTIGQATGGTTSVLASSCEGETAASLIERKRLKMELAALKRDRDALRREREEGRRDDSPASEEPRVVAAYEAAKRAWDRAERKDGDRVECPDCCELIKIGAGVCRFCGWRRDRLVDRGRDRRKKPARRRSRSIARSLKSSKSPTVAIVLSLCIVGLGHVYVGDPTRGLLFFVATIVVSGGGVFVSGGLGWLIGLAIMLWAAMDASALAAQS